MRREPGGCSEPSIAQCFSGVLHLQGYNRMAPPVTKEGLCISLANGVWYCVPLRD